MGKGFFKWGEFDSNDVKHLFVGYIIYGVVFTIAWLIGKTDFDLGLEPQWLALMATPVIAYLWEYVQGWRYSARMDIKDITVSTILGLITTILIETL